METHIIVITLCTQSAVSVIPDFLGFPQTHYTRIPSDFPQESSDPLLVVRKHVCITSFPPNIYISLNDPKYLFLEEGHLVSDGVNHGDHSVQPHLPAVRTLTPLTHNRRSVHKAFNNIKRFEV